MGEDPPTSGGTGADSGWGMMVCLLLQSYFSERKEPEYENEAEKKDTRATRDQTEREMCRKFRVWPWFSDTFRANICGRRQVVINRILQKERTLCCWVNMIGGHQRHALCSDGDEMTKQMAQSPRKSKMLGHSGDVAAFELNFQAFTDLFDSN